MHPLCYIHLIRLSMIRKIRRKIHLETPRGKVRLKGFRDEDHVGLKPRG
jgi:hypothetical protein